MKDMSSRLRGSGSGSRSIGPSRRAHDPVVRSLLGAPPPSKHIYHPPKTAAQREREETLAIRTPPDGVINKVLTRQEDEAMRDECFQAIGRGEIPALFRDAPPEVLEEWNAMVAKFRTNDGYRVCLNTLITKERCRQGFIMP